MGRKRKLLGLVPDDVANLTGKTPEVVVEPKSLEELDAVVHTHVTPIPEAAKIIPLEPDDSDSPEAILVDKKLFASLMYALVHVQTYAWQGEAAKTRFAEMAGLSYADRDTFWDEMKALYLGGQ